MSLYNHIPQEIIYSFIIPYIPCFGISNKNLKLQKKRIKLISYIKKILTIDDIRFIKKDILSNYQGNLDYYYEDENTYLYINLRFRNDYIYIIN